MPNPRDNVTRGPRDVSRPRPPASRPLTDEEVANILAGNGKAIANAAAGLAEEIQDLKSAQIRNFYGPITKIRESNEPPEAKLDRLHLMRPRLVYMKAREPKAGPIEREFSKLISKAEASDKALRGLFDFAEALVAYHKQYQR